MGNIVESLYRIGKDALNENIQILPISRIESKVPLDIFESALDDELTIRASKDKDNIILSGDPVNIWNFLHRFDLQFSAKESVNKNKL